MKSRFRSTALLGGIFVILLLFVVFYENDGADQKRREAQIDRPVMSQQELNSIDGVVMTQNDERVELKKDSGVWMLVMDQKQYRLDAEKASALEESLQGLPVGMVVSRNKENWSQYGFGTEQESEMVLSKAGEPVMTLVMGGSGTSYNSFYLRRNDDEKVYLVDSELRTSVYTPAEQWRDKHLLTVSKDQVVSAAIKVADENWTVSSRDGKWFLTEGDEEFDVTNNEGFTSYWDGLFELKADAFASPEEKFGEVKNQVVLQMKDGESVIVDISVTGEGPASLARVTGYDELLSLGSDLSARLKPGFVDTLRQQNEIEQGQSTDTHLDSITADSEPVTEPSVTP